MPVIPVTQEAEAGESLELGRWRLWRAEIMPLHSGLGSESETPPQKKKTGPLGKLFHSRKSFVNLLKICLNKANGKQCTSQ